MMEAIVSADRPTMQPLVGTLFTDVEMERLLAISARFLTGEREMFSDAEIAHMEFVQWLLANGKLTDDTQADCCTD